MRPWEARVDLQGAPEGSKGGPGQRAPRGVHLRTFGSSFSAVFAIRFFVEFWTPFWKRFIDVLGGVLGSFSEFFFVDGDVRRRRSTIANLSIKPEGF